MKKTPSLYLRDFTQPGHPMTDAINPNAQWVFDHEGRPTQKIDGTACRLTEEGRYLKRYEVKKGKTPPSGFESADDVDPETGKQPGWLPVGDGPEDQYHREALETFATGLLSGQKLGEFAGTYELVGPKIQGNPHEYPTHKLVRHDYKTLALHTVEFDAELPLNQAVLRDILKRTPWIEGIVFHHPDGRRAKIKRTDLGLPWPPAKGEQ